MNKIRACWSWIDTSQGENFTDLYAWVLALSMVQWKRIWEDDDFCQDFRQPVLYATPNVICKMQKMAFEWADWVDIRVGSEKAERHFHDDSRYRVMTMMDSPWVLVDPDCFIFSETKEFLKPIIEHTLDSYEKGKEQFYYYQQDVWPRKFHAFPYGNGISRTVRKVLSYLDYGYPIDFEESGGNLGFCVGTPIAGYLIGSEVVKVQAVAADLIDRGEILGEELNYLHHWMSGIFPHYVAKRFKIPFNFSGKDLCTTLWHTCGGGRNLVDLIKTPGLEDLDRNKALVDTLKKLVLDLGYEHREPVTRSELESIIGRSKLDKPLT